MVGRLVEQEKVGLHYQKPRQMRTHDPATAHSLRWPIEIAFAKCESGEYSLRLRFELPAAVLVENVQGVDDRLRHPSHFPTRVV